MINNANAVLHKFLPSWNIGLSSQTLFLQNPQGHHVLSVPLDSALSLMRQIRNFIQRIKALFAPKPLAIDWQFDKKRSAPRMAGQLYSVKAVKQQNGALWLGLAYGPANGILWRRA